MNLEPFADLLQSGLPDESVFISRFPENVTRGILVLSSSGAKLNPELPDYKVGTVQLIVRERNYKDGFQLSTDVMKEFTVGDVEIGGIYIHFLRPLYDPINLPLTDGGLSEFSLNFKAVYVEHL